MPDVFISYARPDLRTQGYVRTCQRTKVGDPINPIYWDRIVAAAMINDASIACTNGRYEEALDLYKGVQRMPGGSLMRAQYVKQRLEVVKDC